MEIKISLRESLDSFMTMEKLLGNNIRVCTSGSERDIHIYNGYASKPTVIIKQRKKEIHFYSVGKLIDTKIEKNTGNTIMTHMENVNVKKVKELLSEYDYLNRNDFDIFCFESEEDLIKSFNKISYLITQDSYTTFLEGESKKWALK